MARLALGQYGAQHDAIRRLAVRAVAGVPAKDQAAEAAAILATVRTLVRYVRDPVGQEHLTTPVALVRQDRPQGDCDDFSMLTAALLGAVGIRTRFVTIGVSPLAFAHVYLAAFIGGRWVPIDPIADGKPVGWECPAPLRWDWPENRAEGFDVEKAMHAFNQSGDGVGGIFDLFSSSDPKPNGDASKPWGALLPDPTSWYKIKGTIGPTVPGWNASTPAQRTAWLKVTQQLGFKEGERLQAIADTAATAQRVTAAVATFGMSELIMPKWEAAKAQAAAYKKIRTKALADIAAADKAGDAAHAAQLRATLADGDKRVSDALGVLRPLLAADAGLGNPVAALVAVAGGPVVLAALSALLAALAYAISSVGNAVGGVVHEVNAATGGFPWLLVLAAGGAWLLFKNKPELFRMKGPVHA
jgi:hypothetical protein